MADVLVVEDARSIGSGLGVPLHPSFWKMADT
jgi:hypothetical protein